MPKKNPNSVFKHNPWLRLILWFTTIGIAAMIFGFSAQDGDTSNATSDPLTYSVIRATYPDFDNRPTTEQKSIYGFASMLVRKGAHFAVYTLLGLSIRLLLATYLSRYHSRSAWLLGTVYAATDELHQWLNGSRTAMWQDVALDSAGVLAGVILAIAVITLLARRGIGQQGIIKGAD